MWVFAAPALISLVLKLFVLGYAIRSIKASAVFLSLITIFAINNALELSFYLNFFNNNELALSATFRLYFVSTTFVLGFIFLHSINVSQLKSDVITHTVLLIATSISALILYTDLIVAGQRSIGYSVTAIEGELSSLFLLYCAVCLFGSLITLFYGYQTARTQLDAFRCRYSFFALAPIILVFACTAIFRYVDIPINAAGLLPIATTWFLILVIKTESKHKLSDIKRFLPMSLENKAANEFLDLLDFYVENGNKDNVYKDLHDDIERAIISYSLKKCNHNVAQTAKLMGIRNRSTMYAMINRLGIDLDQLKSHTD